MNRLRKCFLLSVALFLVACQGSRGGGPLSESLNPPSTELMKPNPTPTPSSPGALDLNCVDTRVDFADSATVQEVCRLVNLERATNGLKPLVLDMKLSPVAQAHAEDMVNRGYFSHNTPEGLSPFDRMKAASISYQAAGENIAYWYKTPVDVMTAWMNSSGHRANILNSKYGKIGVGFYQNYWVQDFTN